MLSTIKNNINRNLTNLLGWKTKRKIIVFESDDWGSIRMPNKQTYQEYQRKGYNIEKSIYCKYDTIANSDDLNALFDVLSKFKDKYNNYPKFTFNTVVANPDFDKIKNSDYKEYFYEPFTTTLKKYYPKENVFKLWEEGINKGLIKPQFHGREHVNVNFWLKLLREKKDFILDAFQLGFWGVPSSFYKSKVGILQSSFRSSNQNDIEFFKQNIIQGIRLFEEIFNYKPKSFIANNYTFPQELLETLHQEGINGIQSMMYHKIPVESGNVQLKRLYTGKKTSFNQSFTVRNVLFDPLHSTNTYDDVGKCLREIKEAFLFNKPAIINTHRIVYIGALNEDNRIENLIKLNKLLKGILKEWKDVEFLSSDELLSEISK